MDSEPKNMFQTLLKQIQLEPNEVEQGYFKNAEISSVKVHKKEKRWDFYFTFDQLLPFQLFKKFEMSLQFAFSKHVEVDLYIEVKENTIDNEFVRDYWLYVCQKSGVDSPICNQLFSTQSPVYKDGKLNFYIDHEITLSKFSEEFFPPIIEQYKKMGFPRDLRIIPIVDHNAAEKVAQAVIEKNESETAKLTEELTKKHQQNERNGNAKNGVAPEGPIKLGRNINSNTPVMQMKDILEEERSIVIEGYVFDVEVRKLRSERELMIIKMTDYSSSLIVKKFSNNETDEAIFATIKPGTWLKAQGSIQMDTFSNELTMMSQSLQETFHETRQDTAPEGEKRVELHAHTNMSPMDATLNPTAIVEMAAKWGHEAVSITDHGGVYSFPEAYQASKDNNIQVIYGLEADLVDDGVPIASNLEDIDLSEATYTVFDVETTGLSAVYDSIIELAGVKMYKGNVIAEFQEFIDPGTPISAFTTQLTGITSEMVRGSKPEKQVLQEFQAFTEGTILVAHNASFDIGFINKGYGKNNLPLSTQPVIDTLELSRFLYPQYKTLV